MLRKTALEVKTKENSNYRFSCIIALFLFQVRSAVTVSNLESRCDLAMTTWRSASGPAASTHLSSDHMVHVSKGWQTENSRLPRTWAQIHSHRGIAYWNYHLLVHPPGPTIHLLVHCPSGPSPPFYCYSIHVLTLCSSSWDWTLRFGSDMRPWSLILQ